MARSPWPLAMPPAQITGIDTLDAMHGTSTSDVTSPPWAAASWPTVTLDLN